MYGKQKENRKVGQKFSEWVQEMFPGLNQDTAADAIWYASNSVVATEIPADISHPKNIRVWSSAQQNAAALPIDLQDIAPVATAPVMEKRQAEKASKVINRSKSKGEGSATATRQSGKSRW